MSEYIIENLTLLVPSKDDSLNLINNFQRIENYLISRVKNYEIIIISNGSSELDIKSINKLVEKNIYTTHLVYKKKGKGFAIKKGIQEAKYNNILFSDADFSVAIQEFDKFVENNKLKADLVIGSRKIKNSLNLNSPIRRKITGAVFTFLVRSLFNISVYDTQCGFKALSIDSFGKTRHKEDGFVFDVELILLAKLKKLEILEIPVKYIHQDRSTVNIYKDSIKMIIGIFRIFKNYKLNKNY